MLWWNFFPYTCRFTSLLFCWQRTCPQQKSQPSLPLSTASKKRLCCPHICHSCCFPRHETYPCRMPHTKRFVCVRVCVCVCVCVCVRERARERLGESRALYINGKGTVVRECKVVCWWKFKGQRPKLTCTVILPEVIVKCHVRLFLINTIKYAVTFKKCLIRFVIKRLLLI